VSEKKESSLKQSKASKYHPLLSEEALKKYADVEETKTSSSADGVVDESIAEVPEEEDDDDIDPLTAMMLGEVDPLGVNAGGGISADSGPSLPAPPKFNETTKTAPRGESTKVDAIDQVGKKRTRFDEKWDAIQSVIQDKCSVSGKIRFALGGIEDDPASAMAGGSSVVTYDRTKDRLAELEKLEANGSGNGQGDTEMTQKEYVDHIDGLKAEIRNAWLQGDRVIALKRAIQCAKMLSDTRVPKFYPSMFVLVAGILDSFSDLVFDRIREKHKEVSPTGEDLPQQFTEMDVELEAKETCRNWFFKIACIRELLPRVYIELALLQNYRFLAAEEFPSIVQRLSHIIRGIGDPMVAVYARMYLARVSCRILPYNMKAVAGSLEDYIFSYREFGQKKIVRYASDAGISVAEYRFYHSFALDFLCYCSGTNDVISTKLFERVISRYKKHCNYVGVLGQVLKNFDSSIWCEQTMELVSLIKDSDASDYAGPIHAFTSMSIGLCLNAPPSKQKLPFLNKAWKAVKAEKDLQTYMHAASIFVELLIKHYSQREVLILLKDIVKFTRQSDASTIMPDLERIIEVIIAESGTFGSIITSEYFMAILDMFKSDKKNTLCKKLLLSFIASPNTTSDPVIIHTVFDLARNLHDSIDGLTFSDERQQISTLVCRFVEKIEFGRDLEQQVGMIIFVYTIFDLCVIDHAFHDVQNSLFICYFQLHVYVDCRAAFPNFHSVNEKLVNVTACLAMKAYSLVKGKHTRKTASFVKACLAYCHITIPSIEGFYRRMPLFLLCGRVALFNQCIAQADTFFTEAIDAIAKVPAQIVVDRSRRSSEPMLVEITSNIISALVIAPGHPKEGPFFLVKRLMNVLGEYKWQSGNKTKIGLYIKVAQLLCAYSQKQLPYRVQAVESNDTLYAGATKYQQELKSTIKVVMNALVKMLSMLSSDQRSPTSKGSGAGSTNAQDLGTLHLEAFHLIFTSFKFNVDDNAEIAQAAVKCLLEAQNIRSGPRSYRRFLDLSLKRLKDATNEAANNPELTAWAKTLASMQRRVSA
jgi:hypothetical protein